MISGWKLFLCAIFFGALAGPASSFASSKPTLETPPPPPPGVSVVELEPSSSPNFSPSPEYPEASYSDLIWMIDKLEIASVEISRRGDALRGIRKDGSKFSVILNPQFNVADRVASSGADVRYVAPVFNYQPDPGEQKMWLLIALAPWALAALFLIFVAVMAFRIASGSKCRAERVIELLEETNRRLAITDEGLSRKPPPQ